MTQVTGLNVHLGKTIPPDIASISRLVSSRAPMRPKTLSFLLFDIGSPFLSERDHPSEVHRRPACKGLAILDVRHLARRRRTANAVHGAGSGIKSTARENNASRYRFHFEVGQFASAHAAQD